jgi:glycosyltransferase involved in cell wall biosynthesis
MEPRFPEHPTLSIGLVTPGWPADAFPNGIVTYVATLLPSLRRMGHRVSLLAGQVAGDTADPGIYNLARFLSTRSLPERLFDNVSFRISPHATRLRQMRRALVMSARKMISEHAVDILEMEESFGVAAGVRASVDIPICVRLHGPWFLNGPVTGAADDDAFRERVRSERHAITLADGITAPSQDVLDRVRAHYGIELPAAEVIPYPVAPAPTDARWTPDGCDASLVLFVGRFDRHKGGDIVIEAFARILKKVPGARLTFVGPDRGCVADDGRTWSLQEYVRDRLPGALEAGRVEWLGQQPLAALAALRRSALVTVVASRYETFCYAAAEAMALGCPIVATRAGAIPELLRDGSNSLLCRPEDPADLAEKVIAVMGDPAQAAALGRQAALDCERLYHPDVIAARVATFYRGVLARRRPSPRPSSRRSRARPDSADVDGAGGTIWPR